MKLHLKLHPSCFAWLLDNDQTMYGVLNLTSNLIDNGCLIENELEGLNREGDEFDEIIIEKPFLKLQGDNQRKLADDIIHVQRNFGMLLYILNKLYPTLPVTHVSSKVARNKVYDRDHITKDLQLSEAAVLLKGVREILKITPLNLLCLHDCLVLKKYMACIKEG